VSSMALGRRVRSDSLPVDKGGKTFPRSGGKDNNAVFIL